MQKERQEVHDYCVLLADVVKNFGHALRKPDHNTLSDWAAHQAKKCPLPAGLDQALLDLHGPEHWRDIKAEFPNSTASNIHEFVVKDLAAEMFDAAAKGFDALSELREQVGKAEASTSLGCRIQGDSGSMAWMENWQGLCD